MYKGITFFQPSLISFWTMKIIEAFLKIKIKRNSLVLRMVHDCMVGDVLTFHLRGCGFKSSCKI